jgi:hypothetical protein
MMTRSLLPVLLLALACTPDRDKDGYPEDVDCNDEDAAVFPGAQETCDGVDQDCDGQTDNDASDAVWGWTDGDGDGHGDPLTPAWVCALATGQVAEPTDCDDAAATTFPGAAEVPNDGIDQDCNGTDDLDSDGDGVPSTEDCDDQDPDVFPGQVEICDGRDEDCSGTADDGDALGTTIDCPAETCVEARDAGVLPEVSGVTWLTLGGEASFPAWCEQDRAGGGWMVMWKNTGGARGGAQSNFNLIGLVNPEILIAPHEYAPASGAAAPAVVAYREKPGIEILKVISLYRPDGTLRAEHDMVVDLGANKLSDLTPTRSLGRTCNTLEAGKVTVTVDGVAAGSTDRVVTDVSVNFSTGQVTAYQAGLANSRTDFPADQCGQDATNRLTIPSTALTRLDGGSDANAALSNIIVPNMMSAGRDTTRCTFACWDSSNFGGHWDAFTVYVRD